MCNFEFTPSVIKHAYPSAVIIDLSRCRQVHLARREVVDHLKNRLVRLASNEYDCDRQNYDK